MGKLNGKVLKFPKYVFHETILLIVGELISKQNVQLLIVTIILRPWN